MDDTSGGKYDAFEARMQDDFPAKVSLVESFGKPGRLLDVGCGKGYFIKACSDRGIDAMGCDLSDTGVRYAREELGVRAECGLLSDLAPRLGEFDAVTLWATIEHVPDPVGTLREMLSVTRPGGRVFVDTGIADDGLERLLPGLTQWYDPPQHLWVISEAGMRHAMEAAGFEVEHVDRCFDRSAGRRLVRKVRNTVAGAALRGAATIGRLRYTDFCFTRYPLGNLISVVARRPE